MEAEKTSVSIYLLKAGVQAEVEKRFTTRTPLQNGLDGWFHLVEPVRKAPAWLRALEPHLGDFSTQDIQSEAPAGLALVMRGGRAFVIAFGFAWIYLADDWLEPDFGRKVVLNTVRPERVIELNSEQVFARRHVARERSPKPTSFSAFGVELDRDLVAAVEGIPNEPLFGGTIRGATSLRVKIPFPSLPAVLDKADALFASNAYKKHWPEIDNLAPVINASTTALLDNQLDADMRSGVADRDITMCAPSFRRGEMDSASSFVLGRLARSPATSTYLQYSAWKFHLLKARATPSVESARDTRVHMLDRNGDEFEARTVYECLGYEVSSGGESYVLSSGIWYRAERKFTKGIDSTVSALSATSIVLPAWNTTDDEGTYNAACCKGSSLQLMDKKLVHYGGHQSKFEFCDFMHVKKRTLFCAKIPSRSSDCSHLVEQSRRTLELFFSADPGFRKNAKRIVVKHHPTMDASWLDSRPKSGDWKMCLVLMGKKLTELPLFARCSIARLSKYCEERGHPFYVQSV